MIGISLTSLLPGQNCHPHTAVCLGKQRCCSAVRGERPAVRPVPHPASGTAHAPGADLSHPLLLLSLLHRLLLVILSPAPWCSGSATYTSSSPILPSEAISSHPLPSTPNWYLPIDKNRRLNPNERIHYKVILLKFIKCLICFLGLYLFFSPITVFSFKVQYPSRSPWLQFFPRLKLSSYQQYSFPLHGREPSMSSDILPNQVQTPIRSFFPHYLKLW